MGGEKKEKKFSTSDLAKQQNVHPNTVRLYEEWGFIPLAQRTPKGYRIFTEVHCRYFHLARLCARFGFMGGKEAKTAYAIIEQAMGKDWKAANKSNDDLKKIMERENLRANRALAILKDWSQSTGRAESSAREFTSKEAAALANITLEQLRHWERNHLIRPERNHLSYRRMTQEDIDRLVLISTLRKARYSVQALLRMFRSFDLGYRGDFARWLNEPSENEDVVRATDQWLTTLKELTPVPAEIEEVLKECRELIKSEVTSG